MKKELTHPTRNFQTEQASLQFEDSQLGSEIQEL